MKKRGGLPSYMLSENYAARVLRAPDYIAPVAVGAKVRFTGKFLASIGSHSDEVFTVVACSSPACGLCARGNYLALEGGLHVARASVYELGTLTVRNMP